MGNTNCIDCRFFNVVQVKSNFGFCALNYPDGDILPPDYTCSNFQPVAQCLAATVEE